MLILLHVSVALLSMLQASYALIAPSRRKLHATYGLVAATLASGTYLVWSLHSPLLQSCEGGLVYLAVVSSLAVSAHYRLAKLPVRS